MTKRIDPREEVRQDLEILHARLSHLRIVKRDFHSRERDFVRKIELLEASLNDLRRDYATADSEIPSIESQIANFDFATRVAREQEIRKGAMSKADRDLEERRRKKDRLIKQIEKKRQMLRELGA